MKIIRTYDSYIHAHIAIGQLAEYDIPAFLQDEFMVTIDPILSNAIGGIKLTVDDENVSEAQKILGTIEMQGKQIIACPKCHLANVEHIATAHPKNWFTAFLSFFFASYAVAVERKYHCFNCGYEFSEIPEAATTS
jgi:DNA-directed RNA polymerase subunit RPC12/RpoP